MVRFLAGAEDADRLGAEAQRIREELSARGNQRPAEVSVLASDSAAKGFEQLAGNLTDRLVVLGSTHRAGLQRVFPGSVAERLLQHTRCAVAIAPKAFARLGQESAGSAPAADEIPLRDDLRVIAIGFNGRPESRAALEVAAYLGLRAGATLRVIAVGPTLDGGQRLAQPTPRIREGLDDELAAAVRDLPPELRALPVFLRGNPALQLWDKAEEGVDLLVIGSGGEGPLVRAWVNDPGTMLMRSAPCPIILTPQPVGG